MLLPSLRRLPVLRRVPRLLKFSWWRRDRDRDLADELTIHLEMATHDHLERGLSPDDARAAALRELGNAALIRQTTRELSPWSALEQLAVDIRSGARILRQAPGLSVTAVLLIALVIGGNTTVFSIVNGMLVSPAPGVTAPRLLAIKVVDPTVAIADPFVSFPNYEDFARQSKTLSALIAWSTERLTLGTEHGNYAVSAGLVTAYFFDTLGIQPLHGRGLRPADDAAGTSTVAVISERVWRDRFAATDDIVGRAVTINDVAVTIVGVTAQNFGGALLTPGEDVWVPLRAWYHLIGSADVLRNRGQPLVLMVGQHRPSVSLRHVGSELDGITQQLHTAYPETFVSNSARGQVRIRTPRARVARYSGQALLPVADMAPRFLALFSVVTLLTLVVVSANVANLLLGRAVVRQRDTAVRRALGASRGRVLRLLLAEGAVIAAIAWVVSCLFAWWTARVLLQLLEPRPGLLEQVRPDWTLAAYAMVLAGLTTVACAAAPAMRAWRLPVLPLLRSGEHGIARGRSRVSSTLVVIQLAFSVLLLTSAGLAYRSLSLLDSGDVGFTVDNLLLVTVRAGEQPAFITSHPRVPSAAEDLLRLERVRERLVATPGITAATYARRVPGPTWKSTSAVRRVTGEQVDSYVRPVGPEYLSALALKPVAGRDLTSADGPEAPLTAVVNQELASRLFPDASPLGRQVSLADGRTLHIVGVAPDARFDGPVHDAAPHYLFVAQRQTSVGPSNDMTFFVRHTGTLESATRLVSRTIAEADADLPIVAMATMRARLETVTLLERQIVLLLGAFALASLAVAALGQYAAAMFNTQRRARELGVRMALGASVGRIQADVLRDALRLAMPGLLIGFALSAAVAMALRAVLFAVTPVDPLTYTMVLLALGSASVLASCVPAWRAGRVNVVEVLRQE